MIINLLSNYSFASENAEQSFNSLIEKSEEEKDFNKVLDNANKAIELAADSNQFLLAYKLKALAYYNLGNSKQSNKNLHIALSYVTEIDNHSCELFLRLGLTHKSLGDLSTAMKYFIKSRKCFESINQLVGQNSSRNNIAILYYMQGNYTKAIDLWKLNYRTIIENNLDAPIYSPLLNIGVGFHKLGKYDDAIKYYKIALNMAVEKKDSVQMAMCYENLGASYNLAYKIDSSKYYYKKSIVILEKTGSDLMLSELYFNMAGNYIDFDVDSALHFANKSLELALKTDNIDVISDSYFAMYNIYESKKDYKKAFEYFRLYNEAREKILNEQSVNKVAELEATYEDERKTLQIENLESEKQLKEKEIKQRSIISYMLAAGLAVVLIMLVLIFKNYREKKRINLSLEEKNDIITEQKYLVEEKNKEILDSITYAKRIQSAILPPNKLVKEYLQNSFILYKPKDIVAGDFYWMEQKDEMILFAAADCTGHGVPGAMVSVVCNNGLNRSVREYDLTEPGKILDKTREIILQEFEKSEEEVKDGMDIALCSLKYKVEREKLPKTQNSKLNSVATLQYAGAHNPLWIIRNGATDIDEIKANKQPIGKTDNPEPYITHTIELNEGDTIYIFSDGFVDQFGGEQGKKYKSANFKKLLLSIQKINIENQKQLIEQAFETWKGNLEQLDDVCVIGVRV